MRLGVLPLDLDLLLIVAVCLVLASVVVVVARKFKDPFRVDLTARVDVVCRTLDNLVVDDPFWVDHTKNGGGMDL